MKRYILPFASGIGVAGLVLIALSTFGVFSRASSVVSPAASAAPRPAIAKAAPAPAPSGLLSQISALTSLPAAPQSAAARISDVADGANRIVASSVRQASPEIILARRSDGYPCLATPSFSGCFRAWFSGGVDFHSSYVRQTDNPASAFNLTVAGVAADGVSAITFTLADGTSVPVAVKNNVFSTTVNGGLATPAVTGYRIAGQQYTMQ